MFELRVGLVEIGEERKDVLGLGSGGVLVDTKGEGVIDVCIETEMGDGAGTVFP